MTRGWSIFLQILMLAMFIVIILLYQKFAFKHILGG